MLLELTDMQGNLVLVAPECITLVHRCQPDCIGSVELPARTHIGLTGGRGISVREPPTAIIAVAKAAGYDLLTGKAINVEGNEASE